MQKLNKTFDSINKNCNFEYIENTMLDTESRYALVDHFLTKYYPALKK